MTKIPKRIKIGYRDYALQRVKVFKGENQAGQCNNSDVSIQWADRGNLSDNINTLIHESLHGCFYVYGLSEHFGHKEEEIIVNTLANALTAWIKDNPQLINYITEGLNEGH